MTSVTASDTQNPESRKLPTRVSKACERCRRNKSRVSTSSACQLVRSVTDQGFKCDPFRPCSLCVRANVDCSSGRINLPSGASKRKRARDHSCDTDDSQPSRQRPVVNATAATPILFRSEEQHPVHAHGDVGSSRKSGIGVTIDAESRRQSVAPGEADSAVGIAHKVAHSPLRMHSLYSFVTS